MNKNNKRKLFATLTTLSLVATPVAVISCGHEKEVTTRVNTTNIARPTEAAAPAEGSVRAPYQPTESMINPKKGLDFRGLELYQGAVDMSVWRSAPIMKHFEDAYVEQWWQNARVEGWRSIEDYQMYLQYMIETNGPTGFDKFAKNSTPDENWLAWHFAPGGGLDTTYTAGDGSTIRPTWVGASAEPWNDIDNTIAWYQYDTGGDQFVFDANNIDNAWKRLTFMERLIPTTANSIRREASTVGADGGEITDANPAVTRNKYMIDGELLDELPRGFHHYYYVTNDRSEFIRDDNGWKVIVTDRNREKALSTIINPADKLNTGEYNAQYGSYQGGKLSNIYNRDPRHEARGDVKKMIDIKSIDYGTYNKNPDHDIADLYTSNGNAKNNSDPKTFWTGKYSIALKKDSFEQLVSFPYSWFPQEHRSQGGANYDRFGQRASQTWTHPWNGGGYAFQWVEDGHGGRKIYKSLKTMRDVLTQWRANNASVRARNGDDSPAEEFRFWGNWHHVFPVKQWYVDDIDIYRDSGL